MFATSRSDWLSRKVSQIGHVILIHTGRTLYATTINKTEALGSGGALETIADRNTTGAISIFPTLNKRNVGLERL